MAQSRQQIAAIIAERQKTPGHSVSIPKLPAVKLPIPRALGSGSMRYELSQARKDTLPKLKAPKGSR